MITNPICLKMARENIIIRITFNFSAFLSINTLSITSFTTYVRPASDAASMALPIKANKIYNL